MINNKKVLAIIPARGGSKGIKSKNIYTVLGKPLIQYTLEAAKKSQYIDRIYVSTDSQKIANVCTNLGFSVKELRPLDLATDEAKTIDVVIQVIEELKNKKEYFDYVVVLQPTQPLRQTIHIDEAIALLENKGKDSLVSVTKIKEHPLFMRAIDINGDLQPLLESQSTVRRQELPRYFIVNGAIYINTVETLTADTSLNDNQTAYVMSRKYHLDIDDYSDIHELKYKLKLNIFENRRDY